MSFVGNQGKQQQLIHRETQLGDEPSSIPSHDSAGQSARPLFDSIRTIGTSREDSEQAKKNHGALDDFLAEPSWARKIALWLGSDNVRKWATSKKAVSQQIARDIARIDKLIASQLNAILHHEKFKRLEASWRGLEYLVACKEQHYNPSSQLRLQVWNVSWAELRNDQEGAIEFDQSLFFKKVYEEGIGTPNGTPFSSILVDFDLHPRPSREHPFDDITILRRLSETSAAAFAPLFINASPSMFGVESFDEVRQTLDLESLHQKLDYFGWQRFRETEESRFVSVVLPRMLIRKPYRPECDHHLNFAFEEILEKRNDHLWGGAVFGIGEVLIRNFSESGWFSNIRGVERGIVSGGLVVGPTRDAFETEPDANATKPLTDLMITDGFERQLSKIGFMALCPCKDTSTGAFYSCPSAQKPRRYNGAEANANSELSTLTNYILCASRFAHYVKVITRDKIGGSMDAGDLQSFLSDWLIDYVNRDPEASPTRRAEKPLLDASIQVRPKPGRSGEYECEIQLEPFHSFDDVRASLKLDTRLVTRLQNR